MRKAMFPWFLCGILSISPLSAAQSYSSQNTLRELQFENEHVKVWKTTVMPHQPLKMHRHDFARVLVSLKGGPLTTIQETGEREKQFFESGKAYWLPGDPSGTFHADVNESDEPIEIMVIELKTP